MITKTDTDTLLICAGFFGYAQEIKRVLERRGRRVAWFEDRPAIDNITKAMIRAAPWLLSRKADAYFSRILESAKTRPIRDVLVVKGESLSVAMLERMRRALPNARFTLYFWDSYRNMPAGTHRKVPLFDRAFTFDVEDAQRDLRMKLQPLFFLEEYADLRDTPTSIDLLFFGTVHSDRHAVLKRLEANLPRGYTLKKILYSQAKWVLPFRALTDPTLLTVDRKDLTFKPRPKAQILSLMSRSRVIIDIERPIQSGYTMRTIEAVGAGRKLITTNPGVANADFFDPNNIAIIDRLEPRVTEHFLSTPYRPVPARILNRYSLSGWLDKVLPD
jgi:hypothetical protein